MVLVSALKAHSQIRVRIEGHTDHIGSKQYNVRLSQRRADAIKAFFIKHGIDADRLEAKGFGKSQPLIRNRGRRARAKNRRVEFKIITPGPEGSP